MITFTEEKIFTKEQVQQLFLSVNWVSGNYPERLYKALMNSSTVFTVWDNEKLVGLIVQSIICKKIRSISISSPCQFHFVLYCVI